MARYRRRKKKSQIAQVILVLLSVCLGLYLLLVFMGEWRPDTLPAMGGSPAEAAPEEALPPTVSGCEVHFIDVGQGDAILIRSDGYSALIDAGENNQGKVVMDYLKALKIQKIDLLMMTHPHSDHIGGMDTIIENFEIGRIIMPRLPDEQTPTTKTYEDVLMAIAGKGMKITPSRAGAVYELGGGEIAILGPGVRYDELNNTSLVCRFEYGGTRFLLTGDMEKNVETDMLLAGCDLKADVLKIGHHGSSTSTSPRFYAAVDPAFCVISVGDGNSYGHPDQQTLDTIHENGAEIYRTDYQGTVVFRAVNESFEITYENQGRKAA